MKNFVVKTTARAPALAIVLTTKFFMCLIVADEFGHEQWDKGGQER